MRSRAIPLLVLFFVLISTWETAEAAFPSPAFATERRTPAELRRAERLRKRLPDQTRTVQRSDTSESRRQARLLARSRTRRPIPEADDRESVTERVIALVNKARASEGLPALSSHPILERTAQAYAEDMATRGFFSHDDPEGGTPRERILEGGYKKPSCDCSWVYGTGENLAKGQDTAEKVMADWLASPGHRKNILSADYEDIGIGFFDEHWVQHFGVSKVLP